MILSDPDQSGSWTGRWDRGGRPRAWLTCGEFTRSCRRCYGLRDPDGLAVQPRAGRSSSKEAPRNTPAGGWCRTSSSRRSARDQPSDACSRPRRPGMRRRPSSSATTTGSAASGAGRTCSAGRSPSEDALRHHRCRIARVHRRDRRATARLLAACARSSRAAGHRPAARHPPDKVMWLHVFGRLKRGVAWRRRKPRPTRCSGPAWNLLWRLATGPRRGEFLDQRLHVQAASRGASAGDGRTSRSR